MVENIAAAAYSDAWRRLYRTRQLFRVSRLTGLQRHVAGLNRGIDPGQHAIWQALRADLHARAFTPLWSD